MQKRHPIKAIKLIIPVAAAGLISSPDLHRDSIKEFINYQFHCIEPHWEESFPPDFNELNRENGTAAVTGTNTVMTFYENNSNWHSL